MHVEIIQQKGYNFLWIDGHMWMWDLAFEVEIQRKMAEQCYGRVVVVGLGLAVIQKMLIKNPKVDYLLTIEKYKEVYDCCVQNKILKTTYEMKRGVIEDIGDLTISDWFDSICSIKKYDFVIGDIWPEIDPDQLPLYRKFKKKAQEYLKKDGQLLCWGKDYYEYLIEKESKICM